MKIKHQELEIPKDNPFLNCKLDREKYAQVLTQIVDTYADGFVLAINNEWGAGKTTFVKMWQQHLINKKFRTIYFNAWENDYDSNPLVALLAELKSLNTEGKGIASFKKILKGAAVLGRNLLPTIAQAVADKYVETKVIGEAIKDVTKSSLEIFEKEVDEYITKRDELVSFRKELAQYIQNQDNAKPVIFIIDELDRCRPDYAVEVLEKLKHFFSVPGIVFVLSIDKEQLCSSVKGFYGSDSIDASNYLKRFIDLEYHIPKPNIKQSCDYFYSYYDFGSFFETELRRHATNNRTEKEDFLYFSKMLFAHYEIGLREQERVLGLTRLVIKQFDNRQYVFAEVFVLLIYLKERRNNDFRRINEHKLTLEEFVALINEVLPPIFSSEKDDNWLLFITARLILMYYNAIIKHDTPPLHDSFVLNFKFEGDNVELIRKITVLERDRTSDVKLDYVISKICLTESFQS